MTKSDAAPAHVPPELAALAMGFQRSRVLLSAHELGVFDALAAGGATAAQVAGRIGADERATDRLLAALCALELLTREDDRYANTPTADRFLVSHSPDFMAGLSHANHLWDTWSTLTEAVRAGHTVDTRPIAEREDAWFSAFIQAMNWRARMNAPEVVEQVGVAPVTTVLDVGGGSGAYAVAFARGAEGVRATVFDLPNVIPLTRKYVEEAGMSARVDLVAGDYTKDELPEGFDIVFANAILHSNPPEENQRLIRKMTQAANPGGRVVIGEFIVEPDRTAPPFATLFALNMLVGTHGGDTFTRLEVGDWMEEAGLGQITFSDTGLGFVLACGTRPE